MASRDKEKAVNGVAYGTETISIETRSSPKAMSDVDPEAAGWYEQ